MSYHKLNAKFEKYGTDKNLKVMAQTGEFKDIKRDAGRKAKLPGKRISKTGKVYWETRKNRTDSAFKDV